MLESFFLLILSLFVVIKGADLAIKYSTKIAHHFHISTYIIGFLVVAVFSIMPETFISIISAIEKNPSFGLSVLYGSNVADLTLIIAIVSLISRHELKIKSEVIKERFSYILTVFVPIILGLNGYYSRVDGLILLLVGIIFYTFVFRENKKTYSAVELERKIDHKNLVMLIMGIIILIGGSHFTIKSATNLAASLSISPMIIGMFIVGIGTTLPELAFSVRAVKQHHDSLALGDILGTVIADATIAVGLMSLINPFYFNPRIVYLTGITMVLAMILAMHFMKTGRIITQKEASLLLLFYLAFVFMEFLANLPYISQ